MRGAYQPVSPPRRKRRSRLSGRIVSPAPIVPRNSSWKLSTATSGVGLPSKTPLSTFWIEAGVGSLIHTTFRHRRSPGGARLLTQLICPLDGLLGLRPRPEDHHQDDVQSIDGVLQLTRGEGGVRLWQDQRIPKHWDSRLSSGSPGRLTITNTATYGVGGRSADASALSKRGGFRALRTTRVGRLSPAMPNIASRRSSNQ